MTDPSFDPVLLSTFVAVAQSRSFTEAGRRLGLRQSTVSQHVRRLEAAAARRLFVRDTHSVAVFCPTSNLFIGSGLFDYDRLTAAGVRVALATDVGGGTSYSLLQTANEAYKVLQMRGQSWSALQAFYQLTLGNARALGLEGKIGALEIGHEADLVVLDSRATPAMAHRMQSIDGDLAEELFVLMMMGDDRAIKQTYVAGAPSKPG